MRPDHAVGAQQGLWKPNVTSGKNIPNQTVMVNDEDASHSNGETVEVSSQNSATNRSRKELSVARSRMLEHREVEQMELQNLIDRQDAK